jgi:hypothetical protein
MPAVDAVNLLAGGFFLLCFAAAMYVIYKFLALVVSIDAAIMRMQVQPMRAPSPGAAAQEQGSYVPYSEEEAWASEAVAQKAAQEGLSPEEIQEFLKQAVGAATDK